LVNGRVRVNAASGDSALLVPGQQATVHETSGKITTANVDVNRFASWKDNTIWFEETTVKEACAILENWYGVTISVTDKSVESCRITAKYRDEKLENVLKSFAFLLKVKYSISTDGKISIHGNGCK
jgi:transmembrane sensor